MKKYFLASLFSTALIFCVACSPSMNSTERETPRSKSMVVKNKKIITDDSLDDSAEIGGVVERKVNGLKQVQITIRNTTSDYAQINYRFIWFDETGIEIPSPLSSWQTVMLESEEARALVSVAPTDKAEDFRLQLFPNIRKQ